MRYTAAWTLSWIAVTGLVFSAPVTAAAQSATVTIDDCRNVGDTEVRDRIRELASTSLKAELSKVDYPAFVSVHWARANVSPRIDKEVDAAVLDVRSNTSWFDRAYSTVSPSSASRYATAVADRTYNSDGFKAALDELATGVARDAGTEIEKATARVANPVIACVQTALQSRYGGAIAQVFAQESEKNVQNSGEAAPVKIDTADLVFKNAGSISGIVLIVTRRVIAKIVQSVGRRIAGVVASRIVASVAGLVGAALILKDIYEAGDGVFPIIADKMKSDDTKALIKDEIGKTIQADIGQQVEAIAQETAERIYAVWLDFKQKYNRLLALSEKYPIFAAFLKDRRLEQLSKLGQIVDLVFSTEGEDRVLTRIGDGSLNKALLDLPDAGLLIATEQKSLEKALRWTAVAGRDLPKVVEFGLFRTLSPDSLSAENFRKLLSLNDKTAVSRIAALEPQARELVLNLPASEMTNFARRFSDRELAAFAEYERLLEPNAARRLLRAAAEDPRAMQALAGSGLQQAIIGSKDQLAALDMMLNGELSLLSYGRIVKDAELVSGGTVDYRVFWERYWLSVLAAGFVVLILLSWLRRLLFGRPAVVIREQPRRR